MTCIKTFEFTFFQISECFQINEIYNNVAMIIIQKNSKEPCIGKIEISTMLCRMMSLKTKIMPICKQQLKIFILHADFLNDQ
jgi:hypothetical protein